MFSSYQGPRADRFSLNPNSGELHSASALSHSERAEYSLMVTATDRGQAPRSTSCSLTIQVRHSLEPIQHKHPYHSPI